VADDGPGFAADAAADGPPPAAGNPGVGLANTRERLALLYGEHGQLECGNHPGGGGVVRIRLPWRTSTTAGDGG